MVNYYTVLGIPIYSDTAQVKQAYKVLAKRYHPDKNPGNQVAEEKFKEISHAYQVLSNPEKKARHDNLLSLSHKAGKVSQHYRSRFHYKRNQYSGSSHNIIQGIATIGLMLVVLTTVWLFGKFNNLVMDKKGNHDLLNTGIVAENTRIFLWNEQYKEALDLLEENSHLIAQDSFRHLKHSAINQLRHKAYQESKKGDYRSAQRNLNLILEYSDHFRIKDHMLLAENYQYLQEYAKAVNAWLELARQDAEMAAYAYYRIGEIYFLHLNASRRAQKYLELCLEKPTASYVKEDSVVRHRKVLHFYLSCCYMQSEEPYQLIRLVNDSPLKKELPQTYLNLLKAYCATDQQEKACQLQQQHLMAYIPKKVGTEKECCP